MEVIISDQIFELAPDFYRGLVIVDGLTNHPDQAEAAELLEREIDRVARSDDPTDDPRLIAWNEAHKQFKSKPKKYPPSIVNLVGRIAKGARPPFINAVVGLFNYISLKYMLPCGGDDADAIRGDAVLGLAAGDETFLPLGGSKDEHPKPGEAIYYDSATKTVMCRRWNWRNGDATKIEPTSRRLIINIDCLPPIDRETGRAARDEMAELLTKYCQATATVSEVHSDQRRVKVF